MQRRRSVGPVLTAALVLGSLLSSCGVELKAPRFVVDVVPSGVAIDVLSRDAPVPAGETVVLVQNQSDRSVRVLLLKDAPSIAQIPKEVLRAVSPIDSDYVVAASNTVDKRKNELATGGLGYKIYTTSFHVHFARGHRYSLLAVDGDRVDGIQVVAGQRS